MDKLVEDLAFGLVKVVITVVVIVTSPAWAVWNGVITGVIVTGRTLAEQARFVRKIWQR